MAAFTLQVLMPKSDFLTISDFFDDPLTSSFKSDPYPIFAFTLYTAETTKLRRSDPEKEVKQHEIQWMQMQIILYSVLLSIIYWKVNKKKISKTLVSYGGEKKRLNRASPYLVKCLQTRIYFCNNPAFLPALSLRPKDLKDMKPPHCSTVCILRPPSRL